MPLQLTRPLVFFDLETTGVDAKTARIIEISVAKHLTDGTVESKNRRFNPGMPIPPEARPVPVQILFGLPQGMSGKGLPQSIDHALVVHGIKVRPALFLSIPPYAGSATHIMPGQVLQ